MLSAISGGYSPYLYGMSKTSRESQPVNTQWALRRAPETGAPVQPVSPVKAVAANVSQVDNKVTYRQSPLSLEMDPAEMAVRMRMQQAPAQENRMEIPDSPLSLPAWSGGDPAELAVRMRIQYPDSAGQSLEGTAGEISGGEEMKSAAEVWEEGQCQTCEQRKYQDGSDDMGVSFQTPTRIDPDLAASAVRGHEMEHVVREQAKAQREDRKVVSQSVTLHTDICPECGKVYVSGGVTETVTVAKQEPQEEAA